MHVEVPGAKELGVEGGGAGLVDRGELERVADEHQLRPGVPLLRERDEVVEEGGGSPDEPLAERVAPTIDASSTTNTSGMPAELARLIMFTTSPSSSVSGA